MNKKFRVGDKVRLIDEAVECEVSRIVSENKVAIRDENGFEYTVSTGEVVLLFDAGNFSSKEKADAREENIIPIKSESVLSYFGNTESLFLCVVPENFDSLLNTSYKIYLVNSFEEIILYSLHQAVIREEVSSYGVLHAGEEIFAGNFSPRRGSDSISIELKFIVHSSESEIIAREFSFSPEDFTDEKLFLSRDHFRNHILSFDCIAKNEIKIPDKDLTKLVDRFSPIQKKSPAKEKVQGRKKQDAPQLLVNEKTVDLHIEELTDDYTHMSNAEIISLQLNHFHKELDTAILNHYYRIIFIHGKGNGVLRGRIRTELNAMNLKYQDADTSRFGFGATEVLL